MNNEIPIPRCFLTYYKLDSRSVLLQLSGDVMHVFEFSPSFISILHTLGSNGFFTCMISFFFNFLVMTY